MSIKLHFLHCHLASFPENIGAVNDKVMEESYQGRWDVHNDS